MNSRLRPRCLHRCLLVLVGASALMVDTGAAPVTSEARSRALVKIVRAPPARTRATKAVFRFKRAKAARTMCRIDRRRYRPCHIRVQYTRMRAGRHVFRVRARRNGRTTLVRRRWTVVRSLPRVSPSPQPVSPWLPPPSTRLRFADEFNGTTLDQTHWSVWDSPGNRGFGLRRKSAFSLSNGLLVVTAQMINGKLVSGGMANKGDRTYGRYEFRVRTESDPTATLSGVVMTWPHCQRCPDFTENDIYETGPAIVRDEFDTYIHYGRGVPTQALHRHHVDATQWHTVVMDWRADSLKIYRDGMLVWNLLNKDHIPDVPHHLGIQLDPFYPRTLRGPVRMYVDYVRIYE